MLSSCLQVAANCSGTVFSYQSRALDRCALHPRHFVLRALPFDCPACLSYSLIGNHWVLIQAPCVRASSIGDMMPSFRDTQTRSSPTRYRAADYHTLTNRRASSPPSPDLETAHELALQHHHRRPVVTPDKRATTPTSSSMHAAPCTSQVPGPKDEIRQTPRACVKEDSSCKDPLFRRFRLNHPLTFAQCDQPPLNRSLSPSTPPPPLSESPRPMDSSTMSTPTMPVRAPAGAVGLQHGGQRAREGAGAIQA